MRGRQHDHGQPSHEVKYLVVKPLTACFRSAWVLGPPRAAGSPSSLARMKAKALASSSGVTWEASWIGAGSPRVGMPVGFDMLPSHDAGVDPASLKNNGVNLNLPIGFPSKTR